MHFTHDNYGMDDTFLFSEIQVASKFYKRLNIEDHNLVLKMEIFIKNDIEIVTPF